MSQSPSQLRELPAPLPDGEHVIWQGKPTFKGLALRGFHIREVAICIGLLLAWKAWANWSSGSSPMEVVTYASLLLIPTSAGVAMLAGLAFLFRRASCYTITNKRVLIQCGVALPMTVNIPLGKVASAALRLNSDGSGDIPLQLGEAPRMSYVVLWPHIRPWRLQQPQPMLHSVPDAAGVAAKLAEALKGQHDSSAVSVTPAADGTQSSGSLTDSHSPVAA
jgi:hypothetical protein